MIGLSALGWMPHPDKRGVYGIKVATGSGQSRPVGIPLRDGSPTALGEPKDLKPEGSRGI